MTRSAEWTAAMREVATNKAAICVNEIAELLGIDRDTASGLVKGLSYLPIGRKRMYLITDVTKRIASLEVTS